MKNGVKIIQAAAYNGARTAYVKEDAQSTKVDSPEKSILCQSHILYTVHCGDS